MELSAERQKSTNRLEIMTLLSGLSILVERHAIPKENIWTCDETTSIPKGRVSNPQFSAMDANVLTYRSSIKVIKFSLLGCISASREEIPPLFLFPCKSSAKRSNSAPVIGPSDKMKDSVT